MSKYSQQPEKKGGNSEDEAGKPGVLSTRKFLELDKDGNVIYKEPTGGTPILAPVELKGEEYTRNSENASASASTLVGRQRGETTLKMKERLDSLNKKQSNESVDGQWVLSKRFGKGRIICTARKNEIAFYPWDCSFVIKDRGEFEKIWRQLNEPVVMMNGTEVDRIGSMMKRLNEKYEETKNNTGENVLYPTQIIREVLKEWNITIP